MKTKFLKLAAIGLLTITCFCFSAKAQQYDTLTVQRIHARLYTTILINGKKAKLLVDTGADVSMLNLNSKNKLKFGYQNNISQDFGSFGGQRKVFVAFDAKNQFGFDFRTTEFDQSMFFDGILGADILTKRNAIIDYSRNYILLNK